jgi:guanylate kinase
VDTETFEKGIREGRWAEWAKVHGNYYGTSAGFIRRALERGGRLLLDIDVQGARQIRAAFPEAVTIFIMPPSVEELRRRLAGRGTDSPETVEKRMGCAEWEMAQAGEYRHVVVNGELGRAVEELAAIIKAHS